MATPRALSLPYARAPMSQMGNEPCRIVEHNGSERFVVFPSRLLTDGLFVSMLACTVGVMGFAALMWHESAYRQGLGSVPYLGLLGFLMWFRFTHSREQLEFEVTPEELIRTVFRPRGQSEQRWSRHGAVRHHAGYADPPVGNCVRAPGGVQGIGRVPAPEAGDHAHSSALRESHRRDDSQRAAPVADGTQSPGRGFASVGRAPVNTVKRIHNTRGTRR